MLVTCGIEVGTLNPNEFFMQKYPIWYLSLVIKYKYLQQYLSVSLTYMSLIFSPRTTPIERSTMKGLLRPKLDLHLSDSDPKIGVRKKPMSGDKHQIRVMCS